MIDEAIDFVLFVRVVWRAWRKVQNNPKAQCSYVCVTRHGVPCLAVFVGVGREAWRVAQRAVEEFQPAP